MRLDKPLPSPPKEALVEIRIPERRSSLRPADNNRMLARHTRARSQPQISTSTPTAPKPKRSMSQKFRQNILGDKSAKGLLRMRSKGKTRAQELQSVVDIAPSLTSNHHPIDHSTTPLAPLSTK